MGMTEPGSRAHDGEITIRPSLAHRQRSALGAGGVIGAVLLVPGLLLGLLLHDWSPLVLFIFTAGVVAISSFLGQGHNEVFVGPRGVRRVSRDCDLTASWPSLRGLTVRVPGHRIVVFTLDTTGVEVERLRSGHSNAAQSLVRHPPEGFQLRLDREAADALVAEIARRRPDLKGVADWERSSRPT
jgi:hypothetical protein